jgi:hypothetical protein
MTREAALFIMCILMGGCAGVQPSSGTRKSATIADVINKLKIQLQYINPNQKTSNLLECGGNNPASISLEIQTVTLSLQNTNITDISASLGGTKIPLGIPISPSLGAETKRSDGNQIDLTLIPQPLRNDTPPPPQDPSDTGLGLLIDQAADGVLNADHTVKPCLTVDNQPLTVTKTFEVVDTLQEDTTFGFKILYSADLKASRANDAKNTLTVKFIMHGTQANYQ